MKIKEQNFEVSTPTPKPTAQETAVLEDSKQKIAVKEEIMVKSSGTGSTATTSEEEIIKIHQFQQKKKKNQDCK